MPTRKFHKLLADDQTAALLLSLACAVQDRSEKRKTDIVGVACQYGRTYGIRRADFDTIRSTTIGAIIDSVDRHYPVRKRKESNAGIH